MLPADDNTLYKALLARDPAYDGHWFVGVSSTGIYCRLTCPARKPRREHSSFYSSAANAEAAGFRACLRCRPLDPSGYTSVAVEALRRAVTAQPERRWSEADLKALGHDPSTARRAFKRVYGVAFSQFVRAHRLGKGATAIAAGAPVIEAQLDAGYESASGFREAINGLLGRAPARIRDHRPLTAAWIETPIGAMLGIADECGVHLLEFADRAALPTELLQLQSRHGSAFFGSNAVLEQLADQVGGYFNNPRSGFEVPVVQTGSAFTKEVWAELTRIPVGQTRSYGEVARSTGRSEAVRAVARANGANQVALVVPCHRVIGSNGEMVGYGGKLWRKRWLLEHERRCAEREL